MILTTLKHRFRCPQVIGARIDQGPGRDPLTAHVRLLRAVRRWQCCPRRAQATVTSHVAELSCQTSEEKLQPPRAARADESQSSHSIRPVKGCPPWGARSVPRWDDASLNILAPLSRGAAPSPGHLVGVFADTGSLSTPDPLSRDRPNPQQSRGVRPHRGGEAPRMGRGGSHSARRALQQSCQVGGVTLGGEW